MERDAAPGRVTLRVGAGFQRFLRLHISVGVMTHPAASSVWVLLRVECGEQLPHLMTSQTLPLAGPQGPRSRIEGHELGFGRELMARVAVELFLIGERLKVGRVEPCRHSPESYLHVVGQVAALLGTGRINRGKPVRGLGVAGQALNILQSG
jgi:hypothetical protein